MDSLENRNIEQSIVARQWFPKQNATNGLCNRSGHSGRRRRWRQGRTSFGSIDGHFLTILELSVRFAVVNGSGRCPLAASERRCFVRVDHWRTVGSHHASSLVVVMVRMGVHGRIVHCRRGCIRERARVHVLVVDRVDGSTRTTCPTAAARPLRIVGGVCVRRGSSGPDDRHASAQQFPWWNGEHFRCEVFSAPTERRYTNRMNGRHSQWLKIKAGKQSRTKPFHFHFLDVSGANEMFIRSSLSTAKSEGKSCPFTQVG